MNTNIDSFTEIQSADQVNLNQHAVIEASAGTGKTYTLIELVMRLLLEQRMSIDKLLLVTFTEQATGELKGRIRQRLWEALENAKEDAALTVHLEQNLAQLNQASIFTIHGFCHGALKEFAFEQGAVFEAEVVNDNDIRPMILRQMKRRWPTDQALIKQLESFTTDNKLSSIDGLLLDLASKYKPEFDSIYPNSSEFEVADYLVEIKNILDVPVATYELEFKQLNGLKSTSFKNLWQAVIEPFIVNFKKASFGENQNETVIKLFESTFSDKKDLQEIFFKGCPAIYKADHKNTELESNLLLAPQLFKLIGILNQAWKAVLVHKQSIKYAAIPELLKELMQVSQQHKLERGLISYDDMILYMWQQLLDESKLPSDEQLLTQALRNKYQVAIIDEFQDTDVKQWQIFQQLFLNSDELNHRLWVIGDPKQAIYGFRGADLHTYEAAKLNIINQHQGQAYRLGTNFRTAAGLMTTMNQFFADGSGERNSFWFEPETVHVKPPSSELIEVNKTPQIIEMNGLNYLNCLSVDLADADTIKTQLANQIAATIKHQIINQVEVRLKGEQRLLNASDVCILVRGNSDAEYIEKALQQLHIPFTFHKKKNLYQSIEAIHFQILLTALARPNEIKRVNNALLTLFFGLQATQLNDFADENMPNITALWLNIKEAVMVKDWIKVFEYLLHESGALFRARNNSRRLANIKQLKQQLLKAALQNNLGAEALLKLFQQKRQQTSNDEDLHHKDTERKAVKIMTMHISKGLEFPVVFLFGGFGQGPGSSFLTYYDEEQQGMVYDLIKDQQVIYDEQQLKAAHQLYYVAMTRAIFMLFLPYVDETDKPILRPGLYVQTVMARLKESGLYQQTPPEVFAKQADLFESEHGKTPSVKFNLSVPTDLYTRRRNLHSFSSLSHLKSHAKQTTIASDFSHSLTAELMSTESRNKAAADAGNKPQIPGGVKTGHVLHGIFENVPFNLVAQYTTVADVYQDETIMAVIDQQMKLFKLDNKTFDEIDTENSAPHPLDYRQQLADWTWHTLMKPLNALGGQNLASVSTANRCHELSFFWNHGSTHLTGFIDLFFAVPAQNSNEPTDYYILDWKSNYSANGYSPQVLSDEVMTQHQYHWQYQLYAMAMQSWFDALQLKNARLKGAIYVFSRGINCHEVQQNGLFYDDFTEQKWQIGDIKTELLQIDGFGAKS